jgi:hypothetical protein
MHVSVYNARRINRDARLLFFGRWGGEPLRRTSRQQQGVAITSIDKDCVFQRT